MLENSPEIHVIHICSTRSPMLFRDKILYVRVLLFVYSISFVTYSFTTCRICSVPHYTAVTECQEFMPSSNVRSFHSELIGEQKQLRCFHTSLL